MTEEEIKKPLEHNDGSLPNNFDPIKELEKMSQKDALYHEVFGATDESVKKFAGKASYDWRAFEPKLELQGGSSDCVSFSRTNCAEVKAKKEGVTDDEGKELNFSDLDLSVGSGTTQNGNSLVDVAEYARKKGVVLERVCPYTDVWGERAGLIAKIPKTAKRYLMGDYSRVQGDSLFMKGAMVYSPLQIGIPLDYNYNTDAIVSPPAVTRAWHAVTVEFIDEKEQFHIFDHYTKSRKILAANYPMPFVLSFRDLPSDWRTVTEDASKLLARLVGKYVMRAQAHGEMYRVFADRLQKVVITVSDYDMQDELNAFLRQKSNFIGISEADWTKLVSVVEVIN